MDIAAHKDKKNFLLLGISGAGKSTLGALVAKRLNFSFVDMDRDFMKAEGYDSDNPALLLETLSPEELCTKLGSYTVNLLQNAKNTIIATTPLIFFDQFKIGAYLEEFWYVAKKNALSIHMQPTPLEALRRSFVYHDQEGENGEVTKVQVSYKTHPILMQHVYLRKRAKERALKHFNYIGHALDEADFHLRIFGDLSLDSCCLENKIQAILRSM